MNIRNIIPESELKLVNNNSIFNYEVNVNTIINYKSIFERFQMLDFLDNLQILDNGTLILCQNKFGGKAIVSEFTCGLNFCYNYSKFLMDNNLLNYPKFLMDNNILNYKFSIGSDDYHSGWNYDFSLKIINDYPIVAVIKDFDFRTVVEFDSKSFHLNYLKFSYKIHLLFIHLFPAIKHLPKFNELEKYLGHNHE